MDQLLITTIGHAISGVLFLSLGVFVVLQDPKRLLYWLFAGFTVFAGTFGIFLAIGINLPPSSPWAYPIWFLNFLDFPLIAFFFHFTLRLTNREARYKWLIVLSYVIMAFGLVTSLLFPHLFLPEVVPKLFTLSYLTAGPLYVLMVAYFFSLLLLAGYELLRGYWLYEGERLRYEYFVLALLLGYGMGPWDFLLVFDVQVSPMLGMLYGLYAVPIAYGIVSEQLLDIRVVIKRTLLYTFGIALTAGGLLSLIFLNDQIVAFYPWIQFWTIPLISSFFAFILARMYWLQAAEAGLLKYEFITVAAHKLRTPLTRIRWILDTLKDTDNANELHKGLEHIGNANTKLIEITNLLFEVAHTENAVYQYKKDPLDLTALVHEVVKQREADALERHQKIHLQMPSELPVTGDPRRLASVIEVLLENAITYTAEYGEIRVKLSSEGGSARCVVEDTGIGIAPENLRHVFLSFFRSQHARVTNTEGIGLGLYMAKNIVEKHRGRMGVSSPGEGKGSTFWFTLPLRKK
ncbi:MAG: hypothetical protein RIQ56_983 [Candidatus Parcubacteria bacterium]|jgi:signal transduction histidine kinase